jgi:hypothetical protein
VKIPMDTDVGKIIAEYLDERGFDGLCDCFGCGCGVDDLVPCASDPCNCVPAYAETQDGETLYYPADRSKEERK